MTVRDGVAFPDTVVGTDSHTTMINGLGVLGWGVGGIEAEAAMLGQPMSLPQPDRAGRADCRRATGRHDGDRSGADAHADAPSAWRRRHVRGVLRRRLVDAPGRRSRDAVEHVPRVRGDLGVLPRGRADARVLALHGPRGRASTSSSATRRSRGCSGRTATPEPMFSDVVELDCRRSSPRWRAQAAAGQGRSARRVGLVRRGVPRARGTRPQGDRGRQDRSPRRFGATGASARGRRRQRRGGGRPTAWSSATARW